MTVKCHCSFLQQSQVELNSPSAVMVAGGPPTRTETEPCGQSASSLPNATPLNASTLTRGTALVWEAIFSL